jgi:hypothetical protein
MNLNTKSKTTEDPANVATHHEAAAQHHKEAARVSDALKPKLAANHTVIAGAHSAHAAETATSAAKERATTADSAPKAA